MMTSVPLLKPCPTSLPATEDMTNMQIILHLDMDSFYASVEMQRRPELQGRPVVVGADPKNGRGRGVVCTCSYEARAFGIHSAMPVSQAYVLCPHACFLTPDFDEYARVSGGIMNLLRSFGYRSLQVSIDEAFLDISSCGSVLAGADLARLIQMQIHDRFNLTCSIGIGPGKMIAKIASDYKKPGGLTVVEPLAARDFLAPLLVRKIPGVGKKAEAHLLELGIRTIGDLAATDIQDLLGRFGRGAVHLHELALGNDMGELGEYDGIKSVSRETTFETDTDDPALLLTNLESLAAAVHQCLAEEHLRCRCITLKIRYQGFETRTRSRTLPHYTGDPEPIRISSQALLREMYDGRKVRLIGIRLSSFEKQDPCQMTLGV
jgi:DNA polymerase IV (archaeal DinB-like DNA polymerase)